MPDESSATRQQPEEPAPQEQKRKSKPKIRKPKVPTWILWSRSIGMFSVLGGGVGLMQPQYFWMGVGFVFSGLLLLSIDLYYEPQLKPVFKKIVGIVIPIVTVLFSLVVVFAAAPLGVSGFATAREYPSGTTIERFKKLCDGTLRVIVRTEQNLSFDYERLDLSSRPSTKERKRLRGSGEIPTTPAPLG